MNQRRSPFASRLEGPRSGPDLRAEQKRRIERSSPGTIFNPFAASAAAEESPERTPFEAHKIYSMRKILRWLEDNGHGHMCDEVSLSECNPWVYEPLLMDALIKERITSNDPHEIEQLRKYIYAGSWPSRSRRPTIEDVQKDLSRLRALEHDQTSLCRLHSDPDTRNEHSENLKEIIEQFETVETAVRARLRGAELEDATRIIENINARAWLKLKGILAIHNLKATKEVLAEDHLTKDLFKEIDLLRPVRDYLYVHRFEEKPPEH